MRQEEYPRTTTGKLGWGLKKWVITRPDIWYINNIFYDKLAHDWYIRATSLVEKDVEVDFHITTTTFTKYRKERDTKFVEKTV